MSRTSSFVLALLALLGCAPEALLLSTPPLPTVGSVCDPVTASTQSNTGCDGRCGNSQITCTNDHRWTCISPPVVQICTPISSQDAQVSADAVAVDAGGAADVRTGDVYEVSITDVVATDHVNVPTDAPRPVAGAACTNGIGACARTGYWEELRAGVFRCVGLPALPTPERCDQIDNDCDGRIDEDCDCVTGARRLCYTGPASTWGIGICTPGYQLCDANGRWSGGCLEQVLPRASDTCFNQLDDDCDGRTDEDLPCTDAGVPTPR